MTRQTLTGGLRAPDLLFLQYRGLTPAEVEALAVSCGKTEFRCRACARIARALLAASRWFEARSGQATPAP